MGSKTKEALSLVPETDLTVVERCSGHNGTYAIKIISRILEENCSPNRQSQVKKVQPDHLASDCVLAAAHIANIAGINSLKPEHPITLLRTAYGI